MNFLRANIIKPKSEFTKFKGKSIFPWKNYSILRSRWTEQILPEIARNVPKNVQSNFYILFEILLTIQIASESHKVLMFFFSFVLLLPIPHIDDVTIFGTEQSTFLFSAGLFSYSIFDYSHSLRLLLKFEHFY